MPKGTGEATDIVQKEMYTFVDKGGDRVTLRPEATPSMVRAFVEHSLEQTLASPKLYSIGPDVPVRAASEGPLPAVPPARRRSLRREGSGRSMPRSSTSRARSSASWGFGDVELVINSVGDHVCRPAFRQGARGRARRERVEAVRRLPAARADEPAPHLRLQGARGSADHRRVTAFGRLSLRGVPRSISRRSSGT